MTEILDTRKHDQCSKKNAQWYMSAECVSQIILQPYQRCKSGSRIFLVIFYSYQDNCKHKPIHSLNASNLIQLIFHWHGSKRNSVHGIFLLLPFLQPDERLASCGKHHTFYASENDKVKLFKWMWIFTALSWRLRHFRCCFPLYAHYPYSSRAQATTSEIS